MALSHLEENGFLDPEGVVDSLLASMKVGVEIAAENCPRCGKARVDRDSHAINLHKKQTCLWCNYEFSTRTECVCNPLKELNPTFDKQTGKLLLLSTFRLHKDNLRCRSNWRSG